MNIAILGFGVEGKSVLRYVKKHYSDANITVYDKQNVSSELSAGVDFVETGDFTSVDADLIFRSPSVSAIPLSSNENVTSSTKIFFEKCPAPIIGVTGTKGKGTTCSLIDCILRADGKKTHLVGNIGIPALDVLDEITSEDTVIYELSSFQLWDLDRSPQIATVLTIDQDHLDVHDGFEDYIGAKENISKYQTKEDLIVYYEKNPISVRIAGLSSAKKMPYPSLDHAHVSEGFFYYGEHKICSVDSLKLIGEHNIENALAAISVVFDLLNDKESIERGMKSFVGLPHRLELINTISDVKYYDDSFSSAMPALKVALRSFVEPILLIAGGYDRGLDFSGLSDAILESDNVKKVILLGQNKQKIADGLPSDKYVLVDSLEEAVSYAKETSTPGDVVLLSPGSPSFDMFKNFSERGERFKEIVKSYE